MAALTLLGSACRAAGRHTGVALLVIAAAVSAVVIAQDEPDVCDQPNSLQACP